MEIAHKMVNILKQILYSGDILSKIRKTQNGQDEVAARLTLTQNNLSKHLLANGKISCVATCFPLS